MRQRFSAVVADAAPPLGNVGVGGDRFVGLQHRRKRALSSSHSRSMPSAPCLCDVGRYCWSNPVKANQKWLLVPWVTTIRGRGWECVLVRGVFWARCQLMSTGKFGPVKVA